LNEKKHIIEALIFAAHEPLSLSRIQSILGTDDRPGILEDLQSIKRDCETTKRAFELVEVAGGYQFRTRPEMGPWIRKLKRQRAARFTQASLETLAIVAYKQPITRAEIEHIRGVDCGAVIRGLLEKGLFKILGRKDVVGRPLLYGTSKRFLEVFSLKNLTGLPDLHELEELEYTPEAAPILSAPPESPEEGDDLS
jgi:segregation and condensation protein B